MLILVSPETKRRWRELGIYFGYPECCINWFCTRETTDLTEQQEKIIDNHGFIPCPECAKKVTKRTLSSLIKDRVCDTKYPIDR